MSSDFRTVSGLPTLPKDPDAALDYTWDWADWLASAGDTLQGATVTGAGVTVVGTPAVVGSLVVARLAGGTAGTFATATCRITTAGGQIEDRSIQLQILQR